ncbi:MAG: flagellar biosynthesis protein [Bdellovibrio sp.]|nr:flagellar biosynthesis protein [Bdellovibrio sp.]
MTSGPFLYPNVTSVPAQGTSSEIDKNRKSGDKPGEFDQVFGQTIERNSGVLQDAPTSDLNLGQIKAPLKFSAHATQRLRDRKIALDPQTLSRVNDAVDKAAAKGIEDTLVLTSDAALIVSVKNRTVVTALDRNSIQGNVFTNIDGAIVV